jgi:hypothetical protein
MRHVLVAATLLILGAEPKKEDPQPREGLTVILVPYNSVKVEKGEAELAMETEGGFLDQGRPMAEKTFLRLVTDNKATRVHVRLISEEGTTIEGLAKGIKKLNEVYGEKRPGTLYIHLKQLKKK